MRHSTIWYHHQPSSVLPLHFWWKTFFCLHIVVTLLVFLFKYLSCSLLYKNACIWFDVFWKPQISWIHIWIAFLYRIYLCKLSYHVTMIPFVNWFVFLSLKKIIHLVLVGQFSDLVAVIPFEDWVEHIRALFHRCCIHLQFKLFNV